MLLHLPLRLGRSKSIEHYASTCLTPPLLGRRPCLSERFNSNMLWTICSSCKDCPLPALSSCIFRPARDTDSQQQRLIVLKSCSVKCDWHEFGSYYCAAGRRCATKPSCKRCRTFNPCGFAISALTMPSRHSTVRVESCHTTQYCSTIPCPGGHLLLALARHLLMSNCLLETRLQITKVKF